MRITLWRSSILFLSTVALTACSDRVTAPGLPGPDREPPGIVPPALARANPADPTAFPIGRPSRVELSGRAPASRHTLTFPLPAAQVSHEQVVADAREWLARRATTGAALADSRNQAAVETAERLLAASTREEIRAALGPGQHRVVETRAISHLGSGVIEHTATYRIDGRKLLQVVTPARASGLQTLLGDDAGCVDDAYAILESPESACGYDPYFDPQPVLSDLAVLQYEADNLAADIATLEVIYASAAAGCKVEYTAYYAALGAFAWKAGETVYWAITRNAPKAYTSFRDAAFAGGAFAAAYVKLVECLKSGRR